MNNDQKRHLDNHFETICEHRKELHLPFFDSVFLEEMYKVPSNELLYHKMYMEWFKLFPENSRKTPWQTYPNHIPCPIKEEQQYGHQWGKTKTSKRKRKENFNSVFAMNNELAFTYLNKYKVYAAMVLHLFGVRDYSYLVEKIRILNTKLK
jgi:hypothetical protein